MHITVMFLIIWKNFIKANVDTRTLLKLYDQMKQKIISNPDMLYKDYWINKQGVEK